MAAGGNVPELGGYDYEFTNRVPEDWECLVCHLAMKDPVQIVGCGHRLCSICMESLLRRPSPTCPADRQPLSREKIFPDAACHRKILDLTVKCSYFGCSWIGELRSVQKHQSGCLFKVVKCPNSGCTEKLTKQDLKIHVTFECSWRKVNCEYCQTSFIKNQKQKHFGVCQKFPVQCTNKCGLRDIPREKLDVHVRDVCPATEVQCEYKNLGCEAVLPRSDIKSHTESQVEHHLNLAIRGLEVTHHQLRALVSLVKDQSQKIERLEKDMTEVKEQSQQIERIKEDVSTCKEQSQQIGRLEEDVAKFKQQSQHIERLENLCENYAPFVWKIPNFQAVYDRAVSGEQEVILSEPFYLSKNGYKLRMKMMPNGGSTSDLVAHSLLKGKFLSLFIKVIPGEYDSILPWPFTEKIRVTLIDQYTRKDMRENISFVIDFSKDEWPRPLIEKDNGFGYREFVEQNILRSRAYVKNDSIFVMASREYRT
ncbi:hypothetical protein ACROYT_G042223 [Oculina patagonica]